jgi:outer membrane protein TolC
MAGARSAVVLFPALLAAASALPGAGCASEDSDRWLYEKLVYEQAPEIKTRDDAAGRFRRLGGQPKSTLRDLYEMALYRSEVLALTGEELVRIQTLFEQIRGSIFPRVTFDGTWLRQERLPATGLQQSLTLSDRTEYRFTAVQPVFSGLREFYALRQTGSLYRAQEHQVRHARLLLYADTADAFYAVLEIDRELATTQDTLRLAQERLEELEQRNRIGISRRSEVLSQEAETASIRATAERLKGLLVVAWEALRFVTGLQGTPELVDDLPDAVQIPPVEEYLARARERRDDLKAARERVAAAEEGIGMARSGYLPTADLEARYYTHREGVSAEIDWDVVLSFQVPIFEGGVTQAQMRDARSRVRSSQLDLERLTRDTALQVNRAYADLLAFRSELASLEKAVAAAEENYEIVQAEYRRGIVTNIDVLAAFDQLQQARLRRDRARFGSRRSGVRLEAVTGATPGVGR